MNDIEHAGDASAADSLLTWAAQLRDTTWNQPGHHRRALAALAVAETTAGHDPIEHQLIAALIARMRHRAGQPTSENADQWREQALTDTLAALDLMRAETPPLTGQTYVRADTT